MTYSSIKALNIFTHAGGLAEAFKREGDVQCKGYTVLTEDLKLSLEKKIRDGILSPGTIYKFSHQIKPFKEEDEKIDLVFGLIQHPVWQRRELRREWEDVASLEDIPADVIHRRTLHEVMLVARCCKARKIILFFTYNPFHSSLDTMKVFNVYDVWMKCFEISLQGEYMIPSRHIYVLEINCEAADSPEEIIFAPAASLSVKMPTSNKNTIIKKSFVVKHAMMWDLSPWLVKRCIEEVEKIREEEDGKLLQKKNILTIIPSNVLPKGEPINFLGEFSQIPKLNSLGWDEQLINQL